MVVLEAILPEIERLPLQATVMHSESSILVLYHPPGASPRPTRVTRQATVNFQ